MSQIMGHSAFIARRHLMHLARQPWLIAINLVQPFLWLLLFSVTFTRIADIPGFTESSYAQFFLPGLIVMSVLLASGWNGLSMLGDMERGTLDRLLASPASRPALVIGPLLYQAISALVPTGILMGLGYLIGARFHGGVLGLAVMAVTLSAISAALSALSTAVAVLVRREESLIAMVNFLVMPMTFLSTAFMPADLMPRWAALAMQGNPVDWAVRVCRAAFNGEPATGSSALRLGLLVALAAGAMALAQGALGRYRRAA
jgi:ABC-2 type transport system permease protein